MGLKRGGCFDGAWPLNTRDFTYQSGLEYRKQLPGFMYGSLCIGGLMFKEIYHEMIAVFLLVCSVFSKDIWNILKARN